MMYDVLQPAAAASYGGLAAPLFVVYHGPPGDSVDVPVEVCAPIDPAHENGVAAATRCEPAHREACVRVRKAEAVAPHIRSAYVAVEQWIGAQGLEIADAPREVYFTDFVSAEPTDEVCDVAFPVR